MSKLILLTVICIISAQIGFSQVGEAQSQNVDQCEYKDSFTLTAALIENARALAENSLTQDLLAKARENLTANRWHRALLWTGTVAAVPGALVTFVSAVGETNTGLWGAGLVIDVVGGVALVYLDVKNLEIASKLKSDIKSYEKTITNNIATLNAEKSTLEEQLKIVKECQKGTP